MAKRTALTLAAIGFLLAASAFAESLHPQSADAPQDNSAAAANTPASSAKSSTGAPAQIVVPAGTRLPLVLHNSVTTRTAQPGDPLYFETTFPVVINDRIVIPAGSYAQGEITEAKRAAKGKGNAEIRIRLTSLVLPNGYAVKFDAVPTNAGTGGTEYSDKNKEGQINNDRDKAADAGTVIKTTGAGAGIGAIAAGGARGAGVGAAAGAAVGLATVLSMRGPEVELPRGSSVDIMVDRPFYLDASKINFTEPGRAPQIPGPPSRQPSRSIPF
jgi:hypothetical protein